MKLPSFTNFASVFAICALGSALPANAAALIYESFSFATDGTRLVGNTADTGLGTWTGATGPAPISNFTYGDLQTSGSAVQTPTQTLWNAVNATITADLSSQLAHGGDLWFSFIVGKGANVGRLGIAIGDSALGTNGILANESGDSTDQALGGFLSRNTGTFHSLIWTTNAMSTSNFQSTSPTEAAGVGGTASTISLSPNSSIFIVGHAKWGADDTVDDTLTLYAPSSGNLGSPGTVLAVSKGIVSQGSFDTLSIVGGSNGSGDYVQYDELRFGASFADVVPVIPEPTTALLGGLGFLLLLRRRRN